MNILQKILSTQSASYETERMQATIISILDKLNLGYTQDTYGNIYVTKGNADLYPTMVCHIDTVHDINDHVIIQRVNDNLYAFDTKKMEQYGIGGDDKVGIYITLQCLMHFDNFKAVFFLDEEVGCIGSSHADFSFFNDSTIVLQCDRQGYEDFVNEIGNVKLFDDQLLNVIQSTLKYYGRKVTSGGLTDVKSIATKNDVQVANMSCGYYNPHSSTEFINLADVQDTLDMCIKIFTITADQRYTIQDRIIPFKFNNYKYPNTYSTGQYYNKYYHNYQPLSSPKPIIDKQPPQKKNHCPFCHAVMDSDVFYNLEYCYNCEEYFHLDELNTNPNSYEY